MPDLLPQRDSGASDQDNVTRWPNLLIRTVADEGSLVRLSIDDIVVAEAVASSAIDFTTPALTDDWHEIVATAEDVAGNRSSESPVLNVNIDTSAPKAPKQQSSTAPIPGMLISHTGVFISTAMKPAHRS